MAGHAITLLAFPDNQIKDNARKEPPNATGSRRNPGGFLHGGAALEKQLAICFPSEPRDDFRIPFMKLVPIKPSEAFALTPDQRQSFATGPMPYRISGPPGLARLVQRGRGKTGAFWFNEKVFSDLRAKAKADLAGSPASGHALGSSLKEMVGLYMKLCFRNDLAISKDWTENFDAYAILPLRPVDALIAWVGPIKNQPYYSKPIAGKYSKAEFAVRMQLHQQALKGGVGLVASEQQFVIDFDFPANKVQADRILGPFDF